MSGVAWVIGQSLTPLCCQKADQNVVSSTISRPGAHKCPQLGHGETWDAHMTLKDAKRKSENKRNPPTHRPYATASAPATCIGCGGGGGGDVSGNHSHTHFHFE